MPNWLTTIAMVPVFVAGPVIRNISAAPGLNPLATKAAAIGVLEQNDFSVNLFGIPFSVLI